MKRLGNSLTSLVNKLGLPFLLFALAILSFGLLIPFLGFYSDDWTFVWLAHRLGPGGVMLHYVSNRPFLGFLTIPILAVLGDVPWHYHVFSLLSRFASSLVLVWMLNLVWPQQKRLGIFAGIIYLLYPGLTAWPVALMTGEHYYLVFSIFLLSLCFSFLAIRKPHHRRLWTLLAWTSGLLNLLFSEYYFFLELTRPFFLWVIYAETIPTFKEKLRRVIIDFGPFLIEFCLVLLWRMKYFPNQQGWYQVVFFDDFLANPLRTLLDLAGTVGRDFYTVLVTGMVGEFGFPDASAEGNFSLILFPIGFSAALLTTFFLLVLIPKESRLNASGYRKNLPVILLGLICLLMAGPSFWVTNLSPSLIIYFSRFFVPFTLGVSLVYAGLVSSLPKRIFPIIFTALFVFIAVGSNFRTGNLYRIDWKMQQRLFWNIAWRIPSLEPDTLIISNEIPSVSTSNTFLTTVMNWMYDTGPVLGISEDYFYDFENTYTSLDELSSNAIQRRHFRALYFMGSVEDILVMDYEHGCLVILDPEIDNANIFLSDTLGQLSQLSTVDQIGTVEQDSFPMLALMGDEIYHDWCYSYIQAELAGQQEDWERVVQIYETTPDSIPVEYTTGRFFVVFIEAFAHTGQMDTAEQMTDDVIRANPYLADLMCRVWQRIAYDGTLPSHTETTPEDILLNLQCTNH